MKLGAERYARLNYAAFWTRFERIRVVLCRTLLERIQALLFGKRGFYVWLYEPRLESGTNNALHRRRVNCRFMNLDLSPRLGERGRSSFRM